MAEYRFRRIEVTHNGETSRLYAFAYPGEKTYSLFSPEEWDLCDFPSWSLEEGGEGLLFQGGVPYGTSSFHWIDSEPCDAADEELKAAVRKLYEEEEAA